MPPRSILSIGGIRSQVLAGLWRVYGGFWRVLAGLWRVYGGFTAGFGGFMAGLRRVYGGLGFFEQRFNNLVPGTSPSLACALKKSCIFERIEIAERRTPGHFN